MIISRKRNVPAEMSEYLTQNEICLWKQWRPCAKWNLLAEMSKHIAQTEICSRKQATTLSKTKLLNKITSRLSPLLAPFELYLATLLSRFFYSAPGRIHQSCCKSMHQFPSNDVTTHRRHAEVKENEIKATQRSLCSLHLVQEKIPSPLVRKWLCSERRFEPASV